MTDSWKIGAVSGLIAGIVTGFLGIHYAQFIFSLGLPFWTHPPSDYPLMSHIVIVELTMAIIWGIAIGIIYSKVYDLIPGKHIYKGLVFGIILTLIWSVRWVTWDIAYSWIPELKGDLLSLHLYLVFGILLGILYEFLSKEYDVVQDESKIKKFDLRMGIIVGAIGGLLGGITIFFAHVLFWNPVDFPKYVGCGMNSKN